MLRTLLLASVVSAGLFASPTAAPVHAEPARFRGGFPGPEIHRARHEYHVLYRRCVHEPWRCYGVYFCPETAYAVARELECANYLTRVVCR
jgi:hypothetical protein